MWVNLWRDLDFIGRDLALDQPSVFAETSLGNGAHWDMWSDRRLWQTLVELLQVAGRDSLKSIAAVWDMENLIAWPDNRQEVYGAAFVLWLRRILVAPAVFLGALLLPYWG